MVLVDRGLAYRRLNPAVDGAMAYEHYRQTCIASFGTLRRGLNESRYLDWLIRRVEEFPDGHVLALLDGQVVGQLELQVPYGLDRGYVNLFYVAPQWRRMGFGRRLHDFAMSYFRSWEAKWAELHVSASNQTAVEFYRALGYRRADQGDEDNRMWRLEREVI
jgi:ribosomal protein S18 acetylase RimI-like enzyme